ncbi:MAG: TonB-dependent receptor plug domain-containing protein, partial [Pseudomonadota bacterium]
MGAASTAHAQQAPIEEIVTVGIRGSLTRAMDIKRNATGVVDSISAEDIGKFPDLNVAESLQRITGVSIDRSGGEGQQVTVRGLGPQFNTVLVNGRQIATDSAGREFNFDVLSADLITGAD